MNGIGSQLSKNVLGMKFMRKTKEQHDKALLEDKHRKHFTPVSTRKLSDTATTSNTFLKTHIQEVPSYSQVIGYRFGRLSFGGFNPTVEDNVKKRIWKPVHVHTDDEDESDVDSPSPSPAKRMKRDREEQDPVYGSLIATAGKQLMKSHAVKQEDESDSDEEQEEAEDVAELPPRKKGGWVARGFRARGQNSQDNRGYQGGRGRGGGGRKNRGRGRGQPKGNFRRS